MENYLIERPSMISGQGEAVSRVYNLSEGKAGGFFLFPVNQRNKADNLYYAGASWQILNSDGIVLAEDLTLPYSDGFGGAWLKFSLADGRFLRAQGAWHTNSNDFFENTGLDFRDTHLITTIIGEDHVNNEIINVIFKEEDALHSFDFSEQMGKKYAKELQKPVFVYRKSEGGTSSYFEYPEGKTFRDYQK